MRSRKEIESYIPVFVKTDGEKYSIHLLILETLLDIRDLLNKKRRTK